LQKTLSVGLELGDTGRCTVYLTAAGVLSASVAEAGGSVMSPFYNVVSISAL
jgi:hypothetical protein